MEKNKFVAQIGGAFIYSKKPKELAEWYKDYLGINFEINGDKDNIFCYKSFYYKDIKTGKKAYAVWSIIQNKNRPRISEKVFCINYRVYDLELLSSYLQAKGVFVKGIDIYPEGKFAWINDPEGNYIELWEDTTLNE